MLREDIVDSSALERAIERCREARVVLPTFAQLADPESIPRALGDAAAHVGPDEPDPLNLFRLHWRNGRDRRSPARVPPHVVLSPQLTGIQARVVVMLGDCFPLIRAHKVLAAYACLVPRLVSGRFDPTRHRAVWPSTGNYCRGGVAISRLLGCRGIAVLPEGMSRERFEWLERWVADPADIVRTPGTESNVKEIYERCAELALDPDNVILNQFAEFDNHAVHFVATGRALEDVFESIQAAEPGLRLRAFVAATGSAGTLGAGDYLKERYDSVTAAVEALECPTLLRNGYGEHNIQGIGDKHVPLIHNVMATDVVLAVSDRATDRLGVLFGTEAGRRYLSDRKHLDDEEIAALDSFGLSSLCNIVGAIKVAKYYDLGEGDVVATVATDGGALYGSERELALRRYFPDRFDEPAAAEVFGEHVLGATTDNLRELTREDRQRIFNLGYFTWVEQHGLPLEQFEARRRPQFWAQKRAALEQCDLLIDEFNARTAVVS
jgi:cysteine synthase A